MTLQVVVKKLQEALHSRISLPNTEVYEESLTSYFTTQQSELKPVCIVKPISVEDVAEAIKIISTADSSVSLAIRSGGHNPTKGSANIDGGITIDLRDLNTVEVHSSKQSVRVGTGAIWGRVYETLEPLGISVVGAHVYNVGVGGFILGGGLSSLSPRFGFACDMVDEFEVVLASGGIIHANADDNRDLWVALKGGSNNFGVVTCFTLKCFPEGKIWGGLTVSPMTTLDANLQALVAMDAKWDKYASLKQSYTFSAKTKYMIATNIEYTKDTPEPEVTKPFLVIQPFYRNTLRSTTLSELATEIQKLQAASTRQTFYTTSFKISLQHLHDVMNIFKKQVDKVESLEGLKMTLTYQRLHAAIPSYGVERGGNATGLPADLPSLVLAILTCTWSKASDDRAMEDTAETFLKEVDALSAEKGLYHPYIYLNYAGGFQRPLATNRQSSQQTLREVSLKYDSQQFFQNRVHGGFKITD